MRLGLTPQQLWKFTPREMNLLASEDNGRYLQNRKDARKETAILVTYIINTSGTAKSPKQIDAVYESMKVEGKDEVDEREKIQGPRRHYKGSLSKQWKQHEEFLESKSNGGNL